MADGLGARDCGTTCPVGRLTVARLHRLPLLALAGLLGGAAAAGAQVPVLPQIPPQIPTPRVPEAPAVGPGAPSALPVLTPQAGNRAPAGAEQVRFRLNRIELDGATAYPSAALLTPFTPRLGQEIAASDIWVIARQIEDRYRDDGYILTRVVVPEQEIADGVVRLRIIEGAIDKVLIEGDIGPAEVLVYGFLENVLASRPLNIRDLERWALLAGDIPGVSVQTVLRAGAGGGTELVARLARKGYDGVLSLDNRGSRYIGPHMGSAAFALNSLSNFGERTEISYSESFSPALNNNRQQYFIQLANEGFIGSSGLKWRIYGGGGRTEPGDFLRRTGYVGETVIAGAELRYPILRGRLYDLSASVGFDMINTAIKISDVAEPGRSLTNSNDSLRIWRAGLNGRISDDWGGTTRLSLLGHKAVNWYNHLTQPVARPGQSNDFTKWTGEFSRRQSLFEIPEFSVALQSTASGQWSRNVLPNSEKFFLGGARAGRGYYYGQVTGDIGYAASLELQIDVPWELEIGSYLGGPWVGVLQFYAFRDHAVAIDRGPAALPRRTLRASGIGLRAEIDRTLFFELEAVRRDTLRPNTPNELPLERTALYGKATVRF